MREYYHFNTLIIGPSHLELLIRLFSAIVDGHDLLVPARDVVDGNLLFGSCVKMGVVGFGKFHNLWYFADGLFVVYLSDRVDELEPMGLWWV